MAGKLLELKPVYRVSELARALRMSTPQVRRMLESEGVPFLTRRSGSPLRVTFNALHFAMPGLFASIAQVDAVKRKDFKKDDE